MRMSEEIKTKIQKYARILFFLLSWILLLGIITLVALAGLAIFVDGGLWRKHTALIYVIEFVPVCMFIIGCAGGVPIWYKVWSFVLFIFINFQYYTTYGWLGAIHAAFALVIFVISLYVAWGSYQIIVSDKKKNKDNSSSNNFGTEVCERESCQDPLNGNSKINEAG